MRVSAVNFAAAAVLFLLIVGRLIVGIFPIGNAWGFDQARYFSSTEVIAYLLLLFFLWLLTIASSPRRFFDQDRLSASLNSPLFRVIGLACFVLLIFAYTDSTNLLGDGLLRAAELDRPPNLFTLKLHAAEPLNYLIHNYIYRLILQKFGFEPVVTYRFFSRLAGILFLIGLYRLSRKFANWGVPQSTVIFHALGWGGMLYFFGYVESYPLAAAALMLLFVAVGNCSETGGKVWQVTFTFILAFFLHNVSAVALVPLTIVLLRNPRMSISARLAPLSLMWTIVLLWGVFAYPSTSEKTLILFSSASEKSYSLLSADHLLDMLNELLLVSPFFPLMLFLPRAAGESNASTEFRRFLGGTTVFTLICLFFIDPKLGMPRDWDLFCLPLLSLHLYLILRIDWEKTSRWIKTAAVVFPIGITFGWVLLNADRTKSLARYENILQNDWDRSRQGYERLASYHLSKGEISESERAFKESLRRGPTARAHIGLGFVLLGKGELELAGYHFSEAQRIDPNHGLAIVGIGEIYLRQKRWDDLKDILTILHRRFDGSGDPLIDSNIRRLEQEYNLRR